ncbi:MAG: acyltransferase family protein [Deltaproteobacteria bacterium]|nr:acyltransferase family protein [Deltaproteobacteria bacterium]
MNKAQRELAWRIAKKLLPPDIVERLEKLPIRDTGFGYDPYGYEKETAVLGYCLTYFLYSYYFRVESRCHERIPLQGPVIFAGNHSGVIPMDAAMQWVDLITRPEKPLLLRAVVDNFSGFLPFVNVLFTRGGQVVGARRNFEDLLGDKEYIGVFPEGTKGLGKPYKMRYRLQNFNVGFVELSLKYKAPIVPVATVGAEEQAPLLYNLKSVARLLNFPYFPITPFFPFLGPIGILPMPVKYFIEYGDPIRFYEEYGPEAIEDPGLMRSLADRVRLAVQDRVDRLVEERTGIFNGGLSVDMGGGG